MMARYGLADCGDLVNATPAVTRGRGSFGGSFGGLFSRIPTALVHLFKATLFRSCVGKYLSLTLYMDFSFARLAAWGIIWTRIDYVMNLLGVGSLIHCSLSYKYKVTSTLPEKGCNMGPMLDPLSMEEPLSCHTYCDMEPRFFGAHLKNYLRQAIGTIT